MLTGSEVGWVQHGAKVHLVPDISSSAGVGVAIHFRDPGLVSWIDCVGVPCSVPSLQKKKSNTICNLMITADGSLSKLYRQTCSTP